MRFIHINKYSIRTLLLSFFVLIVGIGTGSQTAIAGVTGTIAGRVIDQETGKPLPGVNVYIPETYRGAATNKEGFYVMTNIPAGEYEVVASIIGYQKITKTEVVVLTDLRTRLDFELKPSAIAGDEVVVTAESPMLRKDITGTTRFVSSYEIENVPLQNYQEFVNIQPGVAAGHIRGGRKTEVLYLIDGIPIMEAIEGKAGSELPSSSIIEMTVQTGGFNAEYGNAMSGIVNILTKEGTDEFKGKAEYEVTQPGRNPSPMGREVSPVDRLGEISLSGPILEEKLGYYVSGNFVFPHTRWKDEQFGNRMIVLNADDSYNYNINSKLTYHPTESIKLTAQGLLSMWDWTEYDHKWKYNQAGLPERTKKSYRFSLSGVHTLSSRTFYEIRLSQYSVLKSILGESTEGMPNLSFYDYTSDGKETLNDWRGFIRTGRLPWWMDHGEIQTLAKLDFISQVTQHHQIKTGVHLTYFDLYKKNVQSKFIPTPDSDFPQYITYDTEYQYYPWRGAWYLQDKIDYTSAVFNFGVRFDYFDPRAARPALEEKLVGDRSEWIIDHDKTVAAEPKYQFSPRLGVAFPVTPTNVIHVNYGHFFQMPQFEYLYTNSNLSTAQGFSPLGDPDLKPAKTVMYEISFKSQLGKSVLVDATLFNKDVSNLVDANTYKNPTEEDIYNSSGFTRFVNMAHVNIRGVEFSFERDYNKYISGKANYTYMIAKGTGSSAFEKFLWTERGYKVPVDAYFLSWDQRHTLVMNLDMRKPGLGGMNILWRWNSPLPYTENTGENTVPNNRRLDATSTLDIRLNKTFDVGRFQPYMSLEILNLLDQKNVLWVDHEGRVGGHLHDPGAVDLFRRIRFGFGVDF